MKPVRVFHKPTMSLGFVTIQDKDNEGHLLARPIYEFKSDGSDTIIYSYSWEAFQYVGTDT